MKMTEKDNYTVVFIIVPKKVSELSIFMFFSICDLYWLNSLLMITWRWSGWVGAFFSDSIKNNIKFGKENATDEEIVNAAKMAVVDDNIQSFTNKYETMLNVIIF